MIKKKIFTITFTCLLAFISNSYANDNCSGIDLHWLRIHAPVPPSEIVKKTPVSPSVCEIIIKSGTNYMPLYTGQDFVIAGSMYKDRVQPTTEKIKALKKSDFVNQREDLDKAVVFEYTPKKETDSSIYMFTDPLCPYCNTANITIKDVADEYGVKVKVLFYNVHADKGKKKSVEAVCRNFDFDQYIDSKWKETDTEGKYQCEIGEKIYELSMRTSKRLGIQSVPQFYLEDGTAVNGANMNGLKAALEKFQSQAASIASR